MFELLFLRQRPHILSPLLRGRGLQVAKWDGLVHLSHGQAADAGRRRRSRKRKAAGFEWGSGLCSRMKTRPNRQDAWGCLRKAEFQNEGFSPRFPFKAIPKQAPSKDTQAHLFLGGACQFLLSAVGI